MMPRFVILTHDWPFPHWDLMFEQGEKLLTWRLLEEPELNVPLYAEKSPDHRLHYLDYTGPISGDRGSVDQWDSGEIFKLQQNGGDLLAEVTSDRFNQPLQIRVQAQSILLQGVGSPMMQ